MIFHRGQKVVCVKGPIFFTLARKQPVVGRVYTVRGSAASTEGNEGIYLVEIENPLHPSGIEYGFLAIRFRPVVERKTDISVFTAMLNEQKASEPV